MGRVWRTAGFIPLLLDGDEVWVSIFLVNSVFLITAVFFKGRESVKQADRREHRDEHVPMVVVVMDCGSLVRWKLFFLKGAHSQLCSVLKALHRLQNKGQ